VVPLVFLFVCPHLLGLEVERVERDRHCSSQLVLFAWFLDFLSMTQTFLLVSCLLLKVLEISLCVLDCLHFFRFVHWCHRFLFCRLHFSLLRD